MIKKICLFVVLSLIIVLPACANVEDTSSSIYETETTVLPQQSESETTEYVYQQHMAAVSVPAITETITADDGTAVFQYTYQNMSLILQDPDVAEKVIIDFLNRIDDTRTLAESTAQMAQTAYNADDNWVPYLYHVTYSPTRIDPSVLSLFGTNALYNGAFHPDRTCVSASYDLVTGDVLTLASIMSVTATADNFCQLVLDALSEMSEGDYLYEDYANTVKQRFMTDTSKDEAWYFSQTGLCFYFSPYEIAPYSSGVISVEIPYEKLAGLIRDDYFPPERDTADGSVTVVPFEEADLSLFSQIAEVIENKDGSMYLAYTEDTVQDVRIIVSDAASSYTIFAAYALTPGDAFVVQTDVNALKNMTISYKSRNETHASNFYN